MEAKDTVMKHDQYKRYILKYKYSNDIYILIPALLNKQAEISFKAVIREVDKLLTNKDFYDAMVYWNPCCRGTIRYVLETIHYKLKKWGIDIKDGN